MVARRDKPALFELVKKGPIKPDSHGSLRTPQWFYGGEGEQTPPQPEKTAIPPQATPPKSRSTVSERLGQVIDHLHQKRQAASVGPTPAAPRVAGKARRLTLVAPWWAAILAGLALLLIVLVAFQMGQSNGYNRAKQLTTAGSPDAESETGSTEVIDSLAVVRNSQPRPDMTPPAPPTVNKVETTAVKAPPATMANAAVVLGNSLVLCGDPSWRKLSDVQEFFAKNGVPARIGRLGGRYVLYTEAAFEVPGSDAQAKQLQEKVIQLGKRYNQEKSPNAESFPPATFASAYWQRIENISPVE